ncbi:methyltransferase [Teredinibacter sp. KSP-S5-2]|uniref:class I SAM-dependent methyltransferase n=1 Tax=Teredinibacter sp. KSP-S5-2 TaxID=3034506 RepID=UPI002934FD5F|nr:methyltransferase [Teredinibacter sp. KSP-S5-2]WNO08094.1 methyltransferase [Teredinibacter sp. KSP-S5-2]
MKLTSFVSSLIACAVLTFPFTHATAKGSDLQKLSEVLAAQSDETKTRYEYRHPQETIEFFGIKPGMTVVEALPGGGWYSQILVPYLGEKGRLVGVDYSSELWPHFEWMNEKFLQGRKDWLESFPENAKEWGKGQGAKTEAYTFATLPKKLTKQADAVLFIRALHNLNRFEPKGQFMTQALNESYRMLKKGGVLGVVQHETSDANADGSTGYMEKQALINVIENAGFNLVAESDINQNAKDKADGIVWRLPPTYSGVKDDPKQKEANKAIGESNRMTLKFVKVGKSKR